MNLEYQLICEFIKLRHELGLTQQQMADEAGVIRELIAILETRKKTPQEIREEMLKKLENSKLK